MPIALNGSGGPKPNCPEYTVEVCVNEKGTASASAVFMPELGCVARTVVKMAAPGQSRPSEGSGKAA